MSLEIIDSRSVIGVLVLVESWDSQKATHNSYRPSVMPSALSGSHTDSRAAVCSSGVSATSGAATASNPTPRVHVKVENKFLITPPWCREARQLTATGLIEPAWGPSPCRRPMFTLANSRPSAAAKCTTSDRAPQPFGLSSTMLNSGRMSMELILPLARDAAFQSPPSASAVHAQ